MLNYLLPKLATGGRISLRGSNFMCWPGSEGGAALDFERIARGRGYRLLVHWAGMKASTAGGLTRGDLLQHYERAYYERVPFGAARRVHRALTRTLRALPKTAETWLRAARPAALDRALGRGGPPRL